MFPYNFGFLIVLVIVLKNTTQHSYKIIAVMEYQPVNSSKLNIKERLNANLENYKKIIHSLSHSGKNLLMIVFPESTLEARRGEPLSKFGTKLTVGDTPCISKKRGYTNYLRELSCAAADYNVAIVLNLITVEDEYYYTTDILISFDGSIGYSNRKEDRLGEYDLHHYSLPFEIPSAKDFILTEMSLARHKNAKFYKEMVFSPTSLLTGFKFSYEKMISLKNYRTYLICSNWISQFPFLTSLQVHQMWAQEFNVTIMFSGANNPELGLGGTGIYHGQYGPILMDISVQKGTKVYLYNFTNIEEPGIVVNPPDNKDVDTLAKEMDNFKMEKDPDLERASSVILDTSLPEFVNTVCYSAGFMNRLCCHFFIKMSRNKVKSTTKHEYTYHLLAYKGNKTYHRIFSPGGVEICALLACVNKDVSSCGQRFEDYNEIIWPVTFEQISITATFSEERKETIYWSSQFPNSLLSSMRPIHPNSTIWTKRKYYDNETKQNLVERTFALKEPQNRILTFAIFGRNFTLKDLNQDYGLNKAEFLPSLNILIFINVWLFIIYK